MKRLFARLLGRRNPSAAHPANRFRSDPSRAAMLDAMIDRTRESTGQIMADVDDLADRDIDFGAEFAQIAQGLTFSRRARRDSTVMARRSGRGVL